MAKKQYLIIANLDGTDEYTTVWAESADAAVIEFEESCDEYNARQYIKFIFSSESDMEQEILD